MLPEASQRRDRVDDGPGEHRTPVPGAGVRQPRRRTEGIDPTDVAVRPTLVYLPLMAAVAVVALVVVIVADKVIRGQSYASRVLVAVLTFSTIVGTACAVAESQLREVNS